MTDVDYQVTTSTYNDGHELAGTADMVGIVQLSRQTGGWGFLRFLGVTIPDGATIDSATIEVYAFTAADDDPDMDIYAEDSSSPAIGVETTNNVSDRTKTTASVTWEDTALGVGWHFSPDIKTVIQELVDSYDYSSGLDLVILTSHHASSGDLYTRGFDQDSALAAKLHISYTAGGGGGVSLPIAMHHYRQLRTQ